MKKFYRVLFTVLVSCLSLAGSAQNNFFSVVNESAKASLPGKRVLTPSKANTLTLDNPKMKAFLASLPEEKFVNFQRSNAPILELPMPDGSSAKFRVWESSVQAPELQAKFPEIRTYAGQGIDDRYASIRFDYNPYHGFHAQILSSVTGRIYIDPFARGNIDNYISYFHADNHRNPGFSCGTDAEPTNNFTENVLAGPCRGTSLKTYRFALSCTGEYAQVVGGGAAGPTHAAIVTTTNRISGVYEVELAIRLQLVANNDAVEFLNPTTDPYLNNGGSDLNLITGVINASAIGVGGYDVGHLACTASNAGVAGLGVVCSATQKGRGLTGGLNPVGDGYDIDYVAHEVGHQFNAPHTFNSNQCASAGGSYEPGGGTTIMAYAGICAANENIQPNSDPIFHAQSFDAISNFITTGGGSGCGTAAATGNTLPTITAMNNNNVSIPINTPFVLTGTATDADGDAISYNWEGWDAGAAGSWPSAASSTTRPLFRTRVSKPTGSRTFPDIRVIVANYPGIAAPEQMDGLRGEVLPTVARAMKFRLTVRDNRAGGGGVVSGGDGCQLTPIFQVNAVGTAPFAVTVPNGGESYVGGSTQTVTWNVVGTDQAPISVANVRITLSTDGGLTYPTQLIASTPNDGSEALTIPGPATTTARIRVEAIGNIFFDISNNNFTITAPPTGFTFGTPTPGSAACGAVTNATLTLPTNSVGGFTNAITLTAGASTPAGATVSFSPNPVTPGSSSTVTLTNTSTLAPGTYSIPVTGTATGAGNQTVTVSFTINAGTPPNITQPTPQTVCAPNTATFTTGSTTPGVTYQWQVSTTGTGGTFVNVSTGTGGTTSSYTTPATTAAMNGYAYRVIISNGICSSVTSNAVLLTVNTAAAITTQPTNQSACTGGTATFTVAASGTGVTYQWQQSNAAGGPFVNVTSGTGGTTNSYTTATVTGSTPGFYQVIVNSPACPGSVTSNVVTLTITAAPSITSQPTPQTVCSPNAATFTVAATGSNLSYQWQVSTTGVGGTYTNVTTGTGGTTNTYNTGATTPAMNGYAYHVIVSGTGCGSVTSNNVTLTVNAGTTITQQPTNQAACTGSTATFTVAATGTGLTYQWQQSTSAGGPFVNVTSGTGGTTNSYTTAPVTAGTPGFYQVIVTSATCPPAVTSNVVTLTINNAVVITNQPTSQAVCVPASATFTVGSSTPGATYQWQVSTTGTGGTFTNVTTGTGGNTNTYSTGPTTVSMNGYAYQVIVSSPGCGSLTSTAVTLTVNNGVTVSVNPQDQRGCVGSDFTFSVTAQGANLTYQWQVSTNGGATYTNIAGTPQAPSNGPTYTVFNAQLNQSGNRYRVVVTGGTCGQVITPGALLTVGLKPTVVLTPTYSTVNNPNNPGVLMSTISPVGNYVYQWTLNGAAIPNTLGSMSLPLTADAFGVYSLTVIDVATGCSAKSNDVTITNTNNSGIFIYPNPVVNMMQVRYYSADPASKATNIMIYDNKGARVMMKNYTISGTFGRMDVDMSRMVAGTYHVVVTNASGDVVASGNVIKR